MSIWNINPGYKDSEDNVIRSYTIFYSLYFRNDFILFFSSISLNLVFIYLLFLLNESCFKVYSAFTIFRSFSHMISCNPIITFLPLRISIFPPHLNLIFK